MPCDQQILITADFTQADPALMAETITALAAQGIYATYQDGKIQAVEETTIAAVKTAYAERVIKRVAARKGWAIKQQGAKKLALSRRYETPLY